MDFCVGSHQCPLQLECFWAIGLQNYKVLRKSLKTKWKKTAWVEQDPFQNQKGIFIYSGPTA